MPAPVSSDGRFRAEPGAVLLRRRLLPLLAVPVPVAVPVPGWVGEAAALLRAGVAAGLAVAADARLMGLARTAGDDVPNADGMAGVRVGVAGAAAAEEEDEAAGVAAAAAAAGAPTALKATLVGAARSAGLAAADGGALLVATAATAGAAAARGVAAAAPGSGAPLMGAAKRGDGFVVHALATS